MRGAQLHVIGFCRGASSKKEKVCLDKTKQANDFTDETYGVRDREVECCGHAALGSAKAPRASHHLPHLGWRALKPPHSPRFSRTSVPLFHPLGTPLALLPGF